ncbi:hypothetical protein ACQV2S_01295 [Facklamia sp. P13064]|uniref:hypothetical protein n=1 Tax=Facklamia sp. P13064 TaxID=3421953 RepID=UPI003D17E382
MSIEEQITQSVITALKLHLPEQADVKIEINLLEASELVGRDREDLRKVLYLNRKEIESRVGNSGFVIFPENRSRWRIARKPFIEWWESNLYKTKAVN